MDPADVVTRLRAAGCVFAEEEAGLLLEAAAGDAAELERLVAARVAGAPVEVLVGWAGFRGLRIRTAPGVFVPRRRTAVLVEVALEHLRAGDVAVDLGCGTGAIGAALLAGAPEVEVHAGDVDPAAVACARLNLPPERVHLGDLYDALPEALRGRVRAVVANAPYVPTAAVATMPSEARDHESRVALDGGADGLEVQRRVIAGASDWMAPGGVLVVETGESQVDLTVEAMDRAALVAEVRRDDDVDGVAVLGLRP